MAPKISFTPTDNLFDPQTPIPQELLKHDVVKDFKDRELVGVADADLRITFSPESGDDILIRRIDPENALGYSVHASEEDYFNHLSRELHEPSEEEIMESLNEQ